MKKFRLYFLTGLAVLLPFVISIAIFIYILRFVDRIIFGNIPFLNYFPGFKEFIDIVSLIPGAGFIFTVLLVTLMGFVTRNYLGEKMIALVDRTFMTIPVLKRLYSAVKNIVEAFFNDTSQAYKKVALIQYPKADSYALAFVTGTARGEIGSRVGREAYSLFVPTTPNPTSGFMLILPKEDVIILDMSVEDGIKLVISGGVVYREESGL